MADVRPIGAALFLLPVETRVPLKFGTETLTHVTCARVRLRLRDGAGRTADGWGETPLSVPWVWPSALPYREREAALIHLCHALTAAWATAPGGPHPLEIGHAFLEHTLPTLHHAVNHARPPDAPMPWLAALVCCSPFDIALHDAYAKLVDLPVYQTYGREHLPHDLSAFLEPAPDARDVSFVGRYPSDYMVSDPAAAAGCRLAPGGRAGPAEPGDLTGDEPDDGYPAAAARLDQARRPALPQGQAARQRRRLGLSPAGAAWGDRGRGGRAGGSPPISTAPSGTPPMSTRSSTAADASSRASMA
jgi:L-alanine-DL-glutamate epimerase-like enolase superfamily enzyme